ncbi:MAG: hypothetical protein Q9201_003218 [Fulgogasparrea decipioides]
MTLRNRTVPRTIPGQALAGLYTAAMFNISHYPLNEAIDSFDFTLDYEHGEPFDTHPAPVPFVVTMGVRAVPPLRLKREHVMRALWILGGAFAYEYQLERLWELDIDLYLLDAKSWPNTKLDQKIASGSIVQPPEPAAVTTS